MKYRNRIFAVIICLFLTITMIISLGVIGVQATDNNCELVIDYRCDGVPVGGAVFNIYHISDSNDTDNITLTGSFEGYQITTTTGDMSALALTLYGYTLLDKIAPEYSVKTDNTGRAVISEMENGAYLITSERLMKDKNIYVSEPEIVTLPFRFSSEDDWSKRLTVKPKCSVLTEDTVDVKVLKKWDDEGNESKRPESIEVALLQNGEVYDTVYLTEKNNWRCTWEDLPSSSVWTLVEIIENNYYVIQSQEGITRMLTNSYSHYVPPASEATYPVGVETTPSESTAPLVTTSPSETTPSDETTPPGETTSDENTKLPQTGMLWWPVPLLFIIGVVLVFIGQLIRRGERFET